VVGVDVGEDAGELDPLQQPLWQPWDSRQYSAVLPQNLNSYTQLLSLDLGRHRTQTLIRIPINAAASS
jgi:hypothetical protein